jgi:hypothetical protein
MLRTTIELFPGGSAHRKRTVATADVANVSPTCRTTPSPSRRKGASILGSLPGERGNL